jgi:glycine/D-amino acid oxidase-like deaminating enzyme
MGHLVVMDDSPAQLALTGYSRSLWRELMADFPSTVEYNPCGTIWVAADDEELAEVHSKHRISTAGGVRTEILDPAQLAEAEPNLRPGLAGGLLVVDDGVVNPPAAADYFLQQALANGAELIQGSPAIHAARGEVRLENGIALYADRIVLAPGTDCSLLPALPIRKRKGHLIVTDTDPGFLKHQLVELGYSKNAHMGEGDSVAFNLQPRHAGQLLIGSSRQFDQDDPSPEPAMVTRMLDRALEYMPALAQLSHRHVRTGFRAATPDKLPLIGPADGLTGEVSDESLWLAAGFEGLGITNSLGAARLLAGQILGRASAIDIEPYLPQRFAR